MAANDGSRDRWTTQATQLKGGLATHFSPINLGREIPGGARFLQNFVPALKGGYKKIDGITKRFNHAVPPYGVALTQFSGQTGTSFDIANIHEAPQVGDTLTIAGVTGTYTIDGVAYSSTNKSATLTLDSSLASSPADSAAVTITSSQELIEGLYYFKATDFIFAVRGGQLFKSTGSAWSLVSVPSYGTVLVNGGSQTGTSLAIDGVSSDSYIPLIGDTFQIGGIEGTYTVTASPTITAGAGTLTINPSLASSPADNAALTFRSTTLSSASKCIFTAFNFDGTKKFVMVDGTNNACVVDENGNFSKIQDSDAVGCDYVLEFQDCIFYFKGALVTYTEPFDEEGFNTGAGAGSFRLKNDNTGGVVFRDNLFVFTENSIDRFSGTSSSNFQLYPVSKSSGCLYKDTIQEVGGDVMFMRQDGLAFLGATERIGDFTLSLPTKNIRDEFKSFIGTSSSDFCSCALSSESYYQIIKYNSTNANATGYTGTQFEAQNPDSFSWGSVKGLNAYRMATTEISNREFLMYSNADGYVYRNSLGDTFDYNSGSVEIPAFFYTPYFFMEDPEIRKTIHSVTFYYYNAGIIEFDVSLKFDLSDTERPQPASETITHDANSQSYSSVRFLPEGSGFNVSFEFDWSTVNAGQSEEGIILDSFTIEYSTEDRK